MTDTISKKKLLLLLSCGIIGCILMGGSDWLMIYGDMSFEGNLAWLTRGAAEIPEWRNSIALVFAFPAIAFYALALFGMKHFLKDKKSRKHYTALTAIGLTPWLALHLFYIMILYLFAFLQKSGNTELSFTACEALFSHFQWFVPVGEAVILLPFLYFFYIILRKKTVFGRLMAINNPLLIYVALKLISGLLPEAAFKLAFINGLMSESMIIWFIVFIISLSRSEKPVIKE